MGYDPHRLGIILPYRNLSEAINLAAAPSFGCTCLSSPSSFFQNDGYMEEAQLAGI